jgi:cytosine/adenosine deaminase-related metal-dependent hydrolase
VGGLEVGDRADLVLFEPQRLATYDGEASVQYAYREAFDCHQLVNRADGVVKSVFVGGEQIWSGQNFTSAHGQQRLGQALKAL